MIRLAPLLLALAACPAPSPGPMPPSTPDPSTTPPPAEASSDSCARDSECEITSFAGCCACPQCSIGQPKARSIASLEAEQKQCELVRCDGSHCAEAGACPTPESTQLFYAECQNGHCAAVRK